MDSLRLPDRVAPSPRHRECGMTEADVPRSATDADVRASERRLRLALDTAAMGVLEIALETGAVVVSEHVPRLLGYVPGEVTTTLDWLLSHVHADDRFRVR